MRLELGKRVRERPVGICRGKQVLKTEQLKD